MIINLDLKQAEATDLLEKVCANILHQQHTKNNILRFQLDDMTDSKIQDKSIFINRLDNLIKQKLNQLRELQEQGNVVVSAQSRNSISVSKFSISTILSHLFSIPFFLYRKIATKDQKLIQLMTTTVVK